ncbi:MULTISPECIES: glycosyltransferase [unclassified Leptolyngbya]|uniref:glycosyltransferase n=1 Tax=unclassified Leptolyngbya TaxID=2650499 RepID=UPI001686FA5C|nr:MULTISPECIES: glycosyltransferase [unclassified Leptolyngbya]MBD1911309.1 glycosyltransferase [Leptolyngbya sp. FACHB-8]MBD2156673.1 glycosyltransferase [Leptolyngbya sp. FACHB-16]
MVISSAKPQNSLSAQLNFLAFLSFSLCGLIGLSLLRSSQTPIWDVFGMVGLGTIGIFRWSLFLWRVLRSRFYLHWVFPRWRRKAEQIPVEYLPPMCFLVPTYREQHWITERVFRAIVQEAKTLAQPVTLLVNSSGDEENAAIRAILETEDPGLQHIRLIQMTQKDGKRKAMADALRVLATLNLPPDTVVALMDGDSELAPGTLRLCLPFFRMFPKVGALTTDELPVVKGSPIFSEWFHLRFAQRHYQMCSDSLDRKVMCLTGRFSLFRAEAAFAPSFADRLENDTLDDWLWGRFKFLSGDDKSTWFWLLQRRYDMLYIPDALVYSIETISGSVVDRAYQNMRRWYGNMLRSNGRALALGPNVTGWYIWYNLLDQRISIWTCLLTPGFLVGSLLTANWQAAGVIIAWILFSRPLMLAIVFWGRVSHLKPIHLPILLASQWGSSLVKIWTQMNLATQSWTNRGNQSISAEGAGMTRRVKLGTSRFLVYSQVFSFAILVGWLTGIVNPTWDLAGLWLLHDTHHQPTTLVVDVGQAQKDGKTKHTIIPNDGKDDAAALQTLIAALPADQPVQLNLPIGEIDLARPLEVNRSNLTLKGHGVGRTILVTHTDTTAEAALIVRPAQALEVSTNQNGMAPPPTTLQNVQLSGFTLRPPERLANLSEAPTIVLQSVDDSSVKNLRVEGGKTHKGDEEARSPVILRHTQNIAIEYVSAE